MSHVQEITVPWVPLADFDWSFARSGPLPWNLTVWSIIAVFTALPLWMTVELTVWVFYTFRRWSGLYFWSVLMCTWGVTLHAIGFVLQDCVPECNWIISTILAEIGWVSMVSGFSVVLFSRLHLVVRSHKILRVTLAMIITDAFLFHVPTIVFQFGVSNKPTHKKYLPYMAPMERVQVLGFSIQETIISGIYIYYTLQFLRDSFGKEIVVILCDIIVIALDYCEYFTLKAVLHSFVYAFKLQLEFVILNEVKQVAGRGIASGGSGRLANISSSQPEMPPSPPSKPSGQSWWSSKLMLPMPSPDLSTQSASAFSTEKRLEKSHTNEISSNNFDQSSSSSADSLGFPKGSGSTVEDFANGG